MLTDTIMFSPDILDLLGNISHGTLHNFARQKDFTSCVTTEAFKII